MKYWSENLLVHKGPLGLVFLCLSTISCVPQQITLVSKLELPYKCRGGFICSHPSSTFEFIEIGLVPLRLLTDLYSSQTLYSDI